MRKTIQFHAVAALLSVAATLLVGNRLMAADQASKPTATPSRWTASTGLIPPQAAGKPSLQRPAATMEKLKNLGALLGRALDMAVDLLSGNETDLLSRNKTALLSGNKPEILSGNKPEILSGNKAAILSGNKPKILSDNKTPILSGNTFSVLSNLKIEIHINNSGNSPAPGVMAQPAVRAAMPYMLPPGAGGEPPRTYSPVPSRNPQQR
jgi:hypothetical protein